MTITVFFKLLYSYLLKYVPFIAAAIKPKFLDNIPWWAYIIGIALIIFIDIYFMREDEEAKTIQPYSNDAKQNENKIENNLAYQKSLFNKSKNYKNYNYI